MKKIKEFIKNCSEDIEITGITDNSTKVKKGYLFVATKGYNVDHYDYIEDAIKRGCAFVISDRKIPFDIPHLVVKDINNYYHKICSDYYGINLGDFHFIGITGTDGKTTTATIVSRLLDNCAYIGTNGVCVNNKEYKTNNTTPCLEELYENLSRIKQENVKTIVMEVSSEALLHKRVSNIRFDIIAFTNITGDHLNIHKNFNNYLNTKLSLLDLRKESGITLVNADDNNLNNIKGENIYSYGFNNSDFQITNVITIDDKTTFNIKIKDETYSINSPLIGNYNIYNICLAFSIAYLYKTSIRKVIERINTLKPIKGRSEILSFGQKYKIVLDYAHTINGIKNILDTYSSYSPIICVTGAAGGREHEKRKIIGDLVINKSDIAVFTMDDPRFEDPNIIIDEMVSDHKDYIRIVDRKEAINYALSIAPDNSVVLILGKGRDEYMAIEDKRIPYCDYDVIKEYFTSIKK